MTYTHHLKWAVPVWCLALAPIVVTDPLPEPALTIVKRTMGLLLLVVGVPYAIVAWRTSRDEVAKEAMKFASVLALPVTLLAFFLAMLVVRYWPPAGQALLDLAATSQSGTTPLTTLGFVAGFIFFTLTATASFVALYLGWWIAKR